MNRSLRKAALALTISLTFSQHAAAADGPFTWPEPGTVVTTLPGSVDNLSGNRSEIKISDPTFYYDLNQESEETTDAKIFIEKNRRSLVQQAEPLPAPLEGYQLPLDSSPPPETVQNPINEGYRYLPLQATPSSQYTQSPPEPEYDQSNPGYDQAKSPNQFTVSDEVVSGDAAFMASNIASWSPLFLPSQMMRGGLFVGGETTFLTVGRESYQSVEIDSLISTASIAGQNESGLGAGGRGWVGLRAGNSGVIATAWHFNDENSDVPGSLFGKNAVGLARVYDLQATTVDLELFQEFCVMQSTVRATLGGRYADFQRRGYTTAFGTMDKADVFAGSHGVAEMSGWGLTGSLAGSHPLRRPFAQCKEAEHCVSPWAFQWLVRGSVIDGDALVSARTEAQVSHSAGVARSVDGAIAEWSGVMSSGTLQLGIGYRRPLVCIPAMLDFATGFEGQLQQTGKVGVSSSSDAFLQGNDGSSDFGAASTAVSIVNSRDIVLTGFFMRWALNY